MTKDTIHKIASCWIYPSGEILVVPNEEHDDNLPEFCKTKEQAENSCVKFSCGWGYDAEISEIFLPKRLTIHQAQILCEINEAVNLEYGRDIKINIWFNHMSWKEIQELR